MSTINEIGLLICLCGITSHVIHKIKTNSVQRYPKSYEINGQGEMGESLMKYLPEKYVVSSDSEHSDTQELFNILNRHDK